LGTQTNYPGIQAVKKILQMPGTRVIDTRHWTQYLLTRTKLFDENCNHSNFDQKNIILTDNVNSATKSSWNI
jgi:hypothetical protein